MLAVLPAASSELSAASSDQSETLQGQPATLQFNTREFYSTPDTIQYLNQSTPGIPVLPYFIKRGSLLQGFPDLNNVFDQYLILWCTSFLFFGSIFYVAWNFGAGSAPILITVQLNIFFPLQLLPPLLFYSPSRLWSCRSRQDVNRVLATYWYLTLLYIALFFGGICIFVFIRFSSFNAVLASLLFAAFSHFVILISWVFSR